jgi:hypothetical protein
MLKWRLQRSGDKPSLLVLNGNPQSDDIAFMPLRGF